ncbi:MAG: hypothetical protein V9G19_17920 [Tetrasphaera sp.]
MTPALPIPRRPVGGLLLVNDESGKLTAWTRRGLVAVHVTPLGGWTGITPASDRSRAAAPYDDPRMALAARPLPGALRPSIGFFVAGRRGVVVVQPAGWRAVTRWVVWLPEAGVVHAPGLRAAEPEDLLAFAGAGPRAAPGLQDALAATPGDALSWLVGIHAALGLPGRDLLMAPEAPVGTLVEPDDDSTARFDALMREEAAHLAEVAHPSRRPGGS